MFSGPGVEGQMPGRGEFNTETLQFADQGLGFRQLLLDFQPAFVQQGLQPRNERQLRHAADRTVTRVGCPSRDQHAQRRNPRIGEHLKNGLPHARNIDHQLGSNR